MKTIKSHKNWVSQYQQVEAAVDDAEVLLEFQKEGEASEEEVDEKYKEAVEVIENMEFHSPLPLL